MSVAEEGLGARYVEPFHEMDGDGAAEVHQSLDGAGMPDRHSAFFRVSRQAVGASSERVRELIVDESFEAGDELDLVPAVDQRSGWLFGAASRHDGVMVSHGEGEGRKWEGLTAKGVGAQSVGCGTGLLTLTPVSSTGQVLSPERERGCALTREKSRRHLSGLGLWILDSSLRSE